jgi:hypothetical protein
MPLAVFNISIVGCCPLTYTRTSWQGFVVAEDLLLSKGVHVKLLEHRYRSEAHGIQEIKGSSKQESGITQRS